MGFYCRAEPAFLQLEFSTPHTREPCLQCLFLKCGLSGCFVWVAGSVCLRPLVAALWRVPVLQLCTHSGCKKTDLVGPVGQGWVQGSWCLTDSSYLFLTIIFKVKIAVH